MTSIDSAEIEKFSKLAGQWHDPRGPFRALHKMNPARLAFIRKAAAPDRAGLKPLAGLRALDVGCGGGLVTLPLARMGAEALGIDASPEAIGAARSQAQMQGLDVAFRCASAEDLLREDARFDLVTALEVIEHVTEPSAFLAQCASLVRPGGTLIVSTINRTAQARGLALFVAERILHWAPEGAHDYEKLVTPEEIQAWTPNIDWGAPTGLRFDLIARAWSLSSDASMNYLMAGAKR